MSKGATSSNIILKSQRSASVSNCCSLLNAHLPVKLGNKFVSILSVVLPLTQSDAYWFEPRLRSLDPFDEELDLRRQIFVPAGKAEMHNTFS